MAKTVTVAIIKNHRSTFTLTMKRFLSLPFLCVSVVQLYFVFCIFCGWLSYIRCGRTPQTAKCAAVALTGRTAALASFQRHQPGQPPDKNVDSAALPVLPARHFGGSIATGGSPLGHNLQLSYL